MLNKPPGSNNPLGQPLGVPSKLSRRAALRAAGCGFGMLSLAGLMAETSSPMAPRQPHFTPRAKRVIFLFMQGLELRFFDKTPVGRLVTRATNDVDAVGELFSSGVLNAVGVDQLTTCCCTTLMVTVA